MHARALETDTCVQLLSVAQRPRQRVKHVWQATHPSHTRGCAGAIVVRVGLARDLQEDAYVQVLIVPQVQR